MSAFQEFNHVVSTIATLMRHNPANFDNLSAQLVEKRVAAIAAIRKELGIDWAGYKTVGLAGLWDGLSWAGKAPASGAKVGIRQKPGENGLPKTIVSLKF